MRCSNNFLLRASGGSVAWLLVAATLYAQAAGTAAVRVDAGRVENRIRPTLYGHFIEFMFEGIKFGLHAELLRNRGFEEPANTVGLPRHWEREPDDRNDSDIHFRWDDSVSYPPGRRPPPERVEHSLGLDLRGNAFGPRGLSQARLPIRQGVEYRGSIWIKNQTFEGQMRVVLEQDRSGGPSYAVTEVPVTADERWRRYPFALTPSRSDPLGKLSVLFDGRGRLWLDQISLMPGDAVDGIRRDVFEKVKALRPAFVRWPGGNVAQDYHWDWGIGPRDERPVWTNLSWANELEPSDFGTDEYVRFCRSVGAEPTLVVNVEGRGATAEEAAAWVEYANGPPTSAGGARRAALGHPAPYGVRFWELGNEIWGDWVRGHSDAETYARNYLRYQAAMKAVDPSIELIAVGDNDMDWNRTVLKLAGPQIDYLAIHHYYGLREMEDDALNLMARPLFYERFYQQVAGVLRELVPGREVKLAINEWNTSLPVPRQHSMESALYAARLMNVFERSGDLVQMAAVSDLVNGWSGGLIQASRHAVFVTPTYLAIKLYNEHLGAERVAAEIMGPTFDTSREGRGVPCLDVVVSRSSDGRQVYVKAVNTSPAQSLRTTITVTGVPVQPRGTIETLTAESLQAANSFSNLDVVKVTAADVAAGPSFTVDLPAHSVSVITLAVGSVYPDRDGQPVERLAARLREQAGLPRVAADVCTIAAPEAAERRGHSLHRREPPSGLRRVDRA
jgi:alpha-L-arabinofuranosidase